MSTPNPNQPAPQQPKLSDAEAAALHSNLLILEKILTRLNFTGLGLTFLSIGLLVALLYFRMMTNELSFKGSYGFFVFFMLIPLSVMLYNALRSLYPIVWMTDSTVLRKVQNQYEKIIQEKSDAIDASVISFGITMVILVAMFVVTLFD